MTLYDTTMELVMSYTGLSPKAFFTILFLMVVVYRTVSAMFVDPDEYDRLVAAEEAAKKKGTAAAAEAVVKPPENVEVGEITEEELRRYDGKNPSKPLLMAIKGQIYDVSPSRMFYGPGGPYALFAGREASRALALMSFDPQDLTDNLEGLSASELEVLQDWEYKFMEKYRKVGHLVREKSKIEHDQSADNLAEK